MAGDARRIRSETRALFHELNKAFKEWDDMGIISDEANLYRDMIDTFYDNNNIKVAHNDLFSERKFLTPEQEEELLEIAEGMANSARAFVENFEQISQDENSVYYGADVADIVRSINTINRVSNDRAIREMLDSEETRTIEAEAYKAGIKWEEVEAWIMFEYESSGSTHESLTNRILNAIADYNRNEKSWK